MREHDATAFGRAPQFVLEAMPVTVIGGADGDPGYDLTYAQYVVPMRDGRIVTLSPVGNKLFVWGADGRPQRTIGRRGQGPGEWMRPTGMILLSADTLFIPDAANRRLNWVLPDKGVVKNAGAIKAFSLRSEQLAGVLPGGRMVLDNAGTIPWATTNDAGRSLALVAVAPFDGTEPREIARVPDMDAALRETRYRGRVVKEGWPVGFSRWANVIVWDSLIATAGGDGYRIEQRTPDGRVRSVIQVPVARRPVTAAMRSARIAFELKRLEGPSEGGGVDPAETKRIVREQAFADSLPLYDRLFVTPNRTLWVVDAIAPTDTAWSATAFRLDGAITGRLHVPGKSAPAAFADDRVVLRSVDDDGVVTMSVYRITPQSRR